MTIASYHLCNVLILLLVADDNDNAEFVAAKKTLKARTLIKLKGKYANVVQRIRCIIEKNNFDIQALILNLCAADEENLTVFSSDEAFIKIKNINELFLWIGKYCSMYDFELLLALVESTQCQEAIKLLDDFAEELRCSILKDLDLLSEDGELVNPTEFMPKSHKLVIKYVGGKCTLRAKEKIQNIIYECFHLRKGSIAFKGVQEGCVSFVYQISTAVKFHLLQNEITPSGIIMLAEHHILCIIIDGTELKISPQPKKVHM